MCPQRSCLPLRAHPCSPGMGDHPAGKLARAQGAQFLSKEGLGSVSAGGNRTPGRTRRFRKAESRRKSHIAERCLARGTQPLSDTRRIQRVVGAGGATTDPGEACTSRGPSLPGWPGGGWPCPHTWQVLPICDCSRNSRHDGGNGTRSHPRGSRTAWRPPTPDTAQTRTLSLGLSTAVFSAASLEQRSSASLDFVCRLRKRTVTPRGHDSAVTQPRAQRVAGAQKMSVSSD